MALNGYVQFDCSVQGVLKGNCTQTGHEGLTAVIAFAHNIKSPRDVATGLATGKRQHGPFELTMEIDKTLPLLYRALCTNELLKKVELKLYCATKLGQKAVAGGVEYYTYNVTLENAHISSVDFNMANNKNPDLTRYEYYTRIAFTYNKITETWIDGGITFTDDWENPTLG